ncbi:hypothetical protein MNBD_GAMMA08-214 [hydrothermal vent metagenome]|uniref:Uncharacterized protein n=1 Tax=hydrothermal vent metagenome TaxID=652676 RepID=A0A3B0XCZ1_9ZZZZ
MDTYIIRFYRKNEDSNKNQPDDTLGVIETVDNGNNYYFKSIDELLLILHQLCVTKIPEFPGPASL